jgi:hypothetical protein
MRTKQRRRRRNRDQNGRSRALKRAARADSHLQRLAEVGVELPAPESMDDATLTKKLWEVIYSLAAIHVYLDSTDHLSDRELYTVLRAEVLPEEIPDDLPDPPGSSWILDLLAGSESDAYLKYYADESERQRWKADFPDYDVPPQADLPFDRDRRLPLPRQPRALTH